jgi:hypothetical protein
MLENVISSHHTPRKSPTDTRKLAQEKKLDSAMMMMAFFLSFRVLLRWMGWDGSINASTD